MSFSLNSFRGSYIREHTGDYYRGLLYGLLRGILGV